MKLKNKFIFLVVFALSFFLSHSALASTTDGTIDSIYCYAWGENVGFIDFGSTSGNVHINDQGLSGYAYGENIGWINLSAVTNNEGALGGYAWGENIGFIDFQGVTIDNNGIFSGSAYGENIGWITFGNTNNKVVTDWRPASARSSDTTSGSNRRSSTSSSSTSPFTPVIPLIIPPQPPPSLPTPPAPPAQGPIEAPAILPTEVPNISPPEELVVSPAERVISPSPAPTTSSLTELVSLIPSFISSISKIEKIPSVNITSKIITTTGAISGASISIATVLFANPLSFSELFLIPFRLWSLILAAFGLKKRNRLWGTVYDSVTKQPLDPAYVVLQDLRGNEVATSITDLDGRYGFLVSPGKYKIIASKTNYEFPSKKLSGKTQDELYPELYFNEIIDVIEGGVISKNIPMDSLKFDWNEFAKKDKKLMKFFSRRDVWILRISNILFVFGFLITVISVIGAPAFYNTAILIVYVILFILKRTVLKPRAYGYIEQRETSNPLSFAIMKVFFAGSENEVIHKVADKIGRYYCLVPNGKYYVKIENKNPDESYTLIHTSEPIEVKNGYINEKFEV